MKRIEELGISPAPWHVQEYSYSTNGTAVEGALMFVEYGEERDIFLDDLTSIENARLIAAAPDCYDALQRIVSATEGAVMDFPKWQKDLQKALDDAKKALAKASGEVTE